MSNRQYRASVRVLQAVVRGRLQVQWSDGTVEAPPNKPVDLTLYAGGFGTGEEMPLPVVQRVFTDGTFCLSAHPAALLPETTTGDFWFRLEVSVPGFEPADTFWDATGMGDQPVVTTLEPRQGPSGQYLRFDHPDFPKELGSISLQRIPVRLAGQVVNGADGVPVEAAAVELVVNDTTEDATTSGPDGRFEFSDPVAPVRTVTVDAEHPTDNLEASIDHLIDYSRPTNRVRLELIPE